MGNVEVSFVVDNRLASLKWAFINGGIWSDEIHFQTQAVAVGEW